MDIRLDGKTVVITGAAGGIGYACAEAVLRSGAQVALVGRRKDKVIEIERRLQANRAVKGFALDLCRVADIPVVVNSIREHLGEIDILIQSAGCLAMASGEEISPADWDTVQAVNSRGLFFMMQAVCSQSMIPRKSGAIVNIASIAGIRGMQAPLCAAHYSASKGAVIQITRQAAVEWAHYNIRVNAVAPGGVITDRLRSFPPDFLEKAAAPIPLKRLSEPGDVAGPVCFLASDAARMITGHVLVVDGGGSVVGV